MRLPILVAAVTACLLSQPNAAIAARPQHHPPQSYQQQTPRLDHGERPAVAGALTSQQVPGGTSGGEERRNGAHSSAKRWMVALTAVYCIVAALQLVVFGIQARRLRQTVRTMDQIAGLEMGAFLVVLIGAGVYQEREKGLKFQGMPTLLNSGRTPAYKVNYNMRAAVLPSELPRDFVFPPLSKKMSGQTEMILGPQQSVALVVGGGVDDFVPDQDVDSIKAQRAGKALYVWGFVTYEDIFRRLHKTEFCQSLMWLPDGKIFGLYTPGHNSAD